MNKNLPELVKEHFMYGEQSRSNKNNVDFFILYEKLKKQCFHRKLEIETY